MSSSGTSGNASTNTASTVDKEGESGLKLHEKTWNTQRNDCIYQNYYFENMVESEVFSPSSVVILDKVQVHKLLHLRGIVPILVYVLDTKFINPFYDCY